MTESSISAQVWRPNPETGGEPLAGYVGVDLSDVDEIGLHVEAQTGDGGELLGSAYLSAIGALRLAQRLTAAAEESLRVTQQEMAVAT